MGVALAGRRRKSASTLCARGSEIESLIESLIERKRERPGFE
jgi:hypothetical protein